ncbi:MAG: CRISPR-associated endonuclease Cas1 [Microbacteriaceae bacterium]|nr:CRISPR-associated endonuclease Cas1 [Microbacteriaceae bacterium]
MSRSSSDSKPREKETLEDVTISLVAHTAFCPRRAWLEAAGEQTDTEQMQIGTEEHLRTDDPFQSRPGELRAMEVFHRGWGVHGKLDTVEVTPDGLVVHEYKATPVRRRATVTEPMRVQLALEVACLRSMGCEVAGADIFFTTHHRRVPVDLGETDFVKAHEAVERTRRIISAPTAPEPLEDSPKCFRCSHSGVCLPEERRLRPIERRILVADPDGQIVHLATPGSRAYVRDGRMIVVNRGETLARIPLETMQGLQVEGNIDLSSGLIRELMWRGLTIEWCSGTGRLYGWSSSTYGPNGAVRAAQHVASVEGRLQLAREFIASKISNQATQLRRAGIDQPVIAELRRLQHRAEHAAVWQHVLGFEGDAAALYFAHWPGLLKPRFRDAWPWHGRTGRPATDPLNAMLNYAYALLTADAIRALISCGLDPHAGFLHSSTRNKPALALDLMEEFRAPVADSVVQLLVNNGEVHPADFVTQLVTTRMRDRARKALIASYERRMQTEFRHPIFEYSVTWRRAMEIQARQILGVLDGTQKEYRGIRVR